MRNVYRDSKELEYFKFPLNIINLDSIYSMLLKTDLNIVVLFY